MQRFYPGKEVKKFTDKQGREITLRYPQWSDLDELVRYINKISQENTYITFSGETLTRNEEMEYLIDCYRKIERGDSAVIYALDGQKIIGTTEINRIYTHRTRGYHVGSFGISVENDYRGSGVGFAMATAVLEEAKNNIPGLELVILDVYSENDKAIKMYEKLGFIKGGAFPKGLKYKDRYLDDIKMYLPLR